MVVYFSTATNRRSRGASWSIIAPPFIPEPVANVGKAHYNSLEGSLQKRYSRVPYLGQVFFQLPYTYAHSIDNGSGFRESTTRVPYYNHNQFLASSDFDLRHHIAFSGSWELPFENAWKSGPKRLTQGWTLRPIVTYRTGFPLDISQGISRTKTRTGPSGAGDPELSPGELGDRERNGIQS